MSRTSAKVKNAYNARNYDRINFVVQKGKKDKIQAAASAANLSVNSYIGKAVDAQLIKDGVLLDVDDVPAEGKQED